MASNFLKKYVTKSPDQAMVTTEVDKIEMKSRIYICIYIFIFIWIQKLYLVYKFIYKINRCMIHKVDI